MEAAHFLYIYKHCRIILQVGCLRRTLVNIAIMKVFGKAFLSGVVFAILLIVLVPLFAEGMSPGVAIARLTNNPLKMVSVLQIMCITGLVFGCVASFFSWIGRRNREREETDDLMREYLKKKLQEENEKQY
ncbi:hypothetical protein [Segatella copri]|nr:hypothetical protein [Segatella copri]MQM58751.1 hypothetical protein [Segatella copri]